MRLTEEETIAKNFKVTNSTHFKIKRGGSVIISVQTRQNSQQIKYR
jgi:hypothetical protein